MVAMLLALAATQFSHASPLEVASSNESPKNMSRTFFYFAYGSNLLSQRIHIKNPTAVQRYIGKLKEHRLDFIHYSKNWRGSVSTIVPDVKSEVWGVIWEINLEDLAHLDDQEGVHENIYFPKNVSIRTPEGETIECRTYQECVLPEKYVPPSELPPERQPSFVYLNTIIRGAKEFHIPEEYIRFIESFKHNGYTGEVELHGKSE
ncbi:gamma-glutamyl cyclotransferase-like venom protein isoform 1 precursor [Nasonia vitripennis]|nr:gamma-glutamyl cyclotransferase-like venom protein isoform 1 precursor [Nasonia vitripennis]